MKYEGFIEAKSQMRGEFGFDPIWLPDFLYPFQHRIVELQLLRGRSAVFADCGLGKTPMQLVWAENVVRKTNKPVLILTPLAVSHQTVREAHKFGIEAGVSRDGKPRPNITVTNYEQLGKFDRNDYAGVVCDESSILKNFDGATRRAITDFMRKTPYRSLWTATAAPNDYVELGTHSEAIGNLGFMDMLGRFFKKAESTTSRSDEFRDGIYRFRGHSERDFWRWVCSWAVACRKPSDLGFDDNGFVLPPLQTCEHIVTANKRRDGWLFDTPAITLQEQREERRRTITERCEMAARLLSHDMPAVAWCALNDEGHLLEKLIPGAVEVEGNDPDERKEEVFDAFSSGEVRALVTKPSIAGFGLNWQHCAHQTFFPSHSFEQYYQSVRRCWRFGQTKPVRVDVIASQGEAGVLANMNRKADAADKMFAHLVSLLGNELRIQNKHNNTTTEEVPSWL